MWLCGNIPVICLAQESEETFIFEIKAQWWNALMLLIVRNE